ncbi:uncharacterized protein KY384_002583 [Bacidia gigantensis]|uniref:uncharacterized protein n=1 Tax=Bacidia gigantensis TaxID=2732470 RepID=UPI001D03E3F1|nr:uncharacterized protein KY384_002583 [Bacidia gigantensis]KAG8532706.1 hypothetical protein KY384_002583 [Bacidia gigantensis]
MPASIASQGTNGAGGSYFPPQAFRYERGGTPVLSSSSESDDDDTMTSPSKGKALPSPLDAESYINSLHSLKSSRAGSVYSLSRISLSSQLSQLTSLALPDPSSLGPGISAIPTAVAAATTLNNAAEQIKRWLQKASEVLNGLDAEDDVEWAAAGGREGLSDVDEAISRFEGLIRVYVTAIEELQEREDVSKVSPEQLKEQVDQMEDILREWEGVKRSLKEIKSQVELAMEWEELWNNVLGDIGLELESLSRLVFEMEEARHRAVETGLDTSGGVDMQELDTIVEETPLKAGKPLATRVDLSPANDTGSPLSPSSGIPQDDSRLLSLFAKMQPLRASLDFLPMTLSSFRLRAEKCLPSACQELDSQKRSLERKWSVLENDAQGLRRELGEDRWVLVFRNAGRQAQKLCESVERSMGKLQDAVDKVEAYEAKKSHYGPAIKKVLTIIDKGVTDRQTVNGEILRVHTESKTRWQEIEKEMKNLDSALEDLNMNKNQQLRDSISSIVSIDRSATESIADTPGSSPASSVVMGPSVCLKADASPTLNNSSRRSSTALGQGIRPNGSRRYFSTPGSAPATNLPRKNPVSRSFTNDVSRTASPAPAKFSVTPTPGNRPVRPNIRTDNKPRWNSSSRVDHAEFSTKPRPYPFATPPLHRKGSKTFNSPHSPSGIPLPSPVCDSNHAQDPSLEFALVQEEF